jgi:hypothetical protein
MGEASHRGGLWEETRTWATGHEHMGDVLSVGSVLASMAPGTGDAASRQCGGATGTAINMYQKEEASTFVHSQNPDTQVWDARAFMMTPYSHSMFDIYKINCLDSSTWGRPFPYSVFGFAYVTCLCQQDISHIAQSEVWKLLCTESCPLPICP